MSFGWDDAAGVGLSGGMSFLGSLGTDYLNDKNRKQNSKYALRDYAWQRELDWQYDSKNYFNLAQRYNDANYDLARRYSENSASWATTGLRKAGLNPILAYSQGFNANMGNAGVQSSGHSSGLPSRSENNATFRAPDVLEGLRDMSSARLMEANAQLVQTQADNVEAQTASTLIDAINKAENKGLTGNVGGLFGALNNALTELTGSTGSVLQDAVLDKVTSKYVNDVMPHASESEKKEEKRKAERWLSDVIKEEEDKRREADFQNHYNHMMHGNGVLHMGH